MKTSGLQIILSPVGQENALPKERVRAEGKVLSGMQNGRDPSVWGSVR